jgi:hypothetical protein
MTIYVDEAIWHWRGLKWCHLLADDVDDLHRFAASLGIKRTSFQSPPKVRAPHYDLTGYERLRAIAMGAAPCDGHQIVAVLRRMHGEPVGGSSKQIEQRAPVPIRHFRSSPVSKLTFRGEITRLLSTKTAV